MWGLYGEVRSSCEQGGCGTRMCWWEGLLRGGFREPAPASQAPPVAGSFSLERLCVWRQNHALPLKRRKRWDRGGPAPFHHLDAPLCDPAHLCTWERRKTINTFSRETLNLGNWFLTYWPEQSWTFVRWFLWQHPECIAVLESMDRPSV